MEILERALIVGPMRRPAEWIAPLRSMLAELGKALHLSDRELEALHALPDFLVFAVYAQLISHIAIEFAEACCRVRFNYTPRHGDMDNLDVTVAGLMECHTDSVVVGVCVGSARYARHLGVDRISALSAKRLTLTVIQVDEAEGRDEEGDGPPAGSREAETTQEHQDHENGLCDEVGSH